MTPVTLPPCGLYSSWFSKETVPLRHIERDMFITGNMAYMMRGALKSPDLQRQAGGPGEPAVWFQRLASGAQSGRTLSGRAGLPLLECGPPTMGRAVCPLGPPVCTFTHPAMLSHTHTRITLGACLGTPWPMTSSAPVSHTGVLHLRPPPSLGGTALSQQQAGCGVSRQVLPGHWMWNYPVPLCPPGSLSSSLSFVESTCWDPLQLV